MAMVLGASNSACETLSVHSMQRLPVSLSAAAHEALQFVGLATPIRAAKVRPPLGETWPPLRVQI